MAKQGSIKHYRQNGDAPAPEALPYGELAVAKDGTVFAGDENGTPVKTNATADSAARLETACAVHTSLASTAAASFDGTASINPGVYGTLPPANGGTGQTTLQAARNAMGLGNTLAAVPLANGGTGRNNGILATNVLAGAFPGAVSAQDANRNGNYVRNIFFRNASGSAGVNSAYMATNRK